jgi:23S rRNA pseudouridine1911/1915/1917 synthase
MTRFSLDVLYEDNHLIAVNKAAGVATMGARAGEETLVALVKQYIKRKYKKPGNVYLGVVSRLDAPVTGVVVLARTSKAAARLSRQFAEGTVEKVYRAIVEKAPNPAAGQCVDWLLKSESERRMKVVRPGTAGAREARLSYRTLRKLPRGCLIEVRPATGRKHQIRLQLAHRGWLIVGDAKYGSERRFEGGLALHARSLRFEHPVTKAAVELVAEVPKSWKEFGVD